MRREDAYGYEVSENVITNEVMIYVDVFSRHSPGKTNENHESTVKIVITRPKFFLSIYSEQYYHYSDTESLYDARRECCKYVYMYVQQNKFGVENFKITEIFSVECRQIKRKYL
jgi:hypothetical protein